MHNIVITQKIIKKGKSIIAKKKEKLQGMHKIVKNIF